MYENDNTDEVGPPSSWTLFESFSKRLTVSEDKTSGLVSVSIEHYSPLVAKQWLDMYLAAINTHMQQRQVEKVTNNKSLPKAATHKSIENAKLLNQKGYTFDYKNLYDALKSTMEKNWDLNHLKTK